ncbi:hypothetical protein TRFO_30589 [Tritrichomonas foetus]|uniref:Uncharacterized protein n=1 Tax=Tritrichomonas foetus TaxID=1144522 RepID=A0A1J4JVC3_9EUKA|nr:hypothetical protein TRFO_30589 [Tritrichomonas foetus]|eukprot:OHT02384.1 hypothetical protein TRFO_30589 [Tritrichomonas foetus]
MDDEIDENSLIATAATIQIDSVSHSGLFLQVAAQTNAFNNFYPGFFNNLKKSATNSVPLHFYNKKSFHIFIF